MIPGYKFESEFFLRHERRGREKGLQEGREQGLQEGREQGLQEGLQEGREQGLRSALLALARRRFAVVTAEEEMAIDALRGEQRLMELIESLGDAGSLSEVLAGRERSSGRT